MHHKIETTKPADDNKLDRNKDAHDSKHNCAMC